MIVKKSDYNAIYDLVKFSVECEMERGCADAFISMLKEMQKLGEDGCTREIIFDSDGDGCYRPKFKTEFEYTEIEPRILRHDTRYFSNEIEFTERMENYKGKRND
jgi:hypothetical protein